MSVIAQHAPRCSESGYIACPFLCIDEITAIASKRSRPSFSWHVHASMTTRVVQRGYTLPPLRNIADFSSILYF